jgi:DGQHR domain-containing protein
MAAARSKKPTNELRLPAIEVRQGPARKLYLFAVDGKRLPEFTTVSRVHRDDNTQVKGYQRPEVLRHITEIRRYIESANPLIPNALVIAFDNRVRFEPSTKAPATEYSVPGELVVPIDESEDDDRKPGWIVDGQQRTAAIREARVKSFPISVVGFVTDDDAEQRAQFILVNSTKPLSKSLIYELLPATEGPLPSALVKRHLPSRLLERLNFDSDSPLMGMIQTPTTPDGVVKDNSILRTLESSISDGALYQFRDPMTGDGDIDAMLGVLKPCWKAVKQGFPDAWGRASRKSRLMHGAGIVSLSYLMDAIAEPILLDREVTTTDFVNGLRVIEPLCHWTSGEWDFGDGSVKRWNGLQNTSQDVQALTSFLLYEYRVRSSTNS